MLNDHDPAVEGSTPWPGAISRKSGPQTNYLASQNPGPWSILTWSFLQYFIPFRIARLTTTFSSSS